MANVKLQHNKGSSAGNGHFTPRFSIGVRFISLIILVALLAGGIGTFVAVTISRDSIREEALSANLAQAKLAASFASEYISTIQVNIRAFADRPDIRQAILNNTPEQLQSALANFVQVQTALETAAVFDANGIQRVNSVLKASTVGQSFADRAWFQEIMATHEPVQSAPVTSRLTGNPSVPYSVPILDEQGQIRGMLNGVITLSKLSDAIVNINYSSDTRVSILYIRDGGIILAHSDPERIMTPVSGKNKAVSLVLSGQSGAIETTSSSGELDLIGFAQVPDLPWGVLVITPSATALAIGTVLTQTTLISTGLISLSAGIIGIGLVLGVTRPLRRLVTATENIGQGNLDYKIDTRGKDEVGDLARATASMAHQLKHTLVSRDKLIEEIAERNKTELALKENETRLQSLFSNMTEGVALHELVMDETGRPVNYRIIDVNSQFENIVGLKRGDVIGALATEVYGTADAPYLGVYSEVALTGKPLHLETYFAPMNRHFDISVAPWGKQGFATIFTDVTESKKAQERIKSALAEKELLLKEIHHRVKNNMQVISSLLGLQGQYVTDEPTRRMLKESQDRIKSMSLVYNKLYDSPDLAHISFKEYVSELVKNLVYAYTLSPGAVATEIDVADLTLDLDTAIPVGLIINELVTNALKYAFPEGRCGVIGVSFHRTDGIYLLSVRDNGAGLPEGFDPRGGRSLGMKLVTALAEHQLSGKLTIKRDGGTEFRVVF